MREAAAEAERILEAEREHMEEERRQLEAAQAAERERLVREAEAAAARALEAERQREEEEQRRRAAQETAERERQISARDGAAAAERRVRREKQRKPQAEPAKPEIVAVKALPPVPVATAVAAAAPLTAAPKPSRKTRAAAVRPQPESPFADFHAVVAGTHANSVFQNMPVTAWARSTRPAQEHAPEQDEAVALLTRFKLPVDVSGFCYPSGCRIRRVRVPAVMDRVPAAAGPVIVSKRRLEELRTSR